MQKYDRTISIQKKITSSAKWDQKEIQHVKQKYSNKYDFNLPSYVPAPRVPEFCITKTTKFRHELPI